MVIKPQKGTVFAWWFLGILLFSTGIYALTHDYAAQGIMVILMGFIITIGLFTNVFSIYYLDYEGITQKCLFVERHFYWKDFKFIGKQDIAGVSRGARSRHIRCSTAPLPKNLTAKEFEKKLDWPLTKTITIEWPDKVGDEFYQKFLSYCGGERDIRE